MINFTIFSRIKGTVTRSARQHVISFPVRPGVSAYMMPYKRDMPTNTYSPEMKKILTLLFFTLLSAAAAEAQSTDRSRGLGAVIGEPTGVSAAYWTTGSNAFSAGAAWHFVQNPSLHIHADYLFYRFDIIEVTRGSLPLYFGLGARIRFDDEDKFGVRFPLGVAYHFADNPLEIFFELVPVLELVPGTTLAGNSGIGIRYYF